MTRVLTLEVPQVGSFTMVPGEVLTLGRHKDNKVVLADNSVSRRHARIEWLRDDEPTIEDLGSSNGVKVAGFKTQGKHPLHDGDKLVLGNLELHIGLAVEQRPSTGRYSRMADVPPERVGWVKQEGGLRDVILDLERIQATGVLQVEPAEKENGIAFRKGRIIDAVTGTGQQAAVAVRVLVGVKAGTYYAFHRTQNVNGKLNLIASALLSSDSKDNTTVIISNDEETEPLGRIRRKKR